MSDWIDQILTAWKGHRTFAEWLVSYIKPDIVVELGVDYGFSTFVFASALEKNDNGIIVGIDCFQGDPHTGFRNTYDHINSLKQEHNIKRLDIRKGYFSEVVKTWNTPIDILHIDGLHTYHAVKEDFDNWSPFVKEDGIILFHDTAVPHFQIKEFFYQLSGGYKLYFRHSAGLGIYTKNKKLAEKIKEEFKNRYNIPPVFDFEENQNLLG
jgi:predicted O-methyltransferase YrrM